MRLARHSATLTRSPRFGVIALAFAMTSIGAAACGDGAKGVADSAATPAVATGPDDTLRAAVITDTVPNDSDDPAIWLDSTGAVGSLILGTDKGDSTGGVFVFNLDGRIDSVRSQQPLRRMNNVDIVQGLTTKRGRIDIAVATERGRQRLRIFRLPDMTPIDNGGIELFDGDTTRSPMGVSLYQRPSDGAVFAIVGGKSGPADGYLWQYRLEDRGDGTIRGVKVRAFGQYSGKKEIEAIAVDDALGFVYYSDETVGIRKYHADPDRSDANEELALFATTGFVEDHEGMAIYPTSDSTGFLIASDQQGQRIQIFRREGEPGKPHEHRSMVTIPVSAMETDGLEVTSYPVSPRFPRGVLIMMSTDKRFHIFDWRDVETRIPGIAR